MIEVPTHGMAHGGDAVGRVDGKVYFVPGAMPGEKVAGTIERDRGSWARLSMTSVLEPSPHRVEPPCPHFDVCGGCQWQFATHDAQAEWKRSIVVEQLAHIGKIHDVEVHETVTTESVGYRNRLDVRIKDGVPGLRKAASHDLAPIDSCLIAHAGLNELFDCLRGTDLTTATLRVGTATGDRLLVHTGGTLRVPDGVSVAKMTKRGLGTVIGDPFITEKVAGKTFRVTGTNFFQVNTAGAEVLVEQVNRALQPQPEDVLLDAYAGGGLFSATVGAGCFHSIAVESDPGGLADLARNVPEAERIAKRVEHLDGGEWDLVVADPPRAGLRAAGVAAITSAGPRAIALVSCDPASLARDSRLLIDSGYTLVGVTPVDMFPHTFHIEAVAHFARAGA
ncbi:MAG: class I SAM-dependent RNA methyltransferase [Acidimicrobiia bacterium]|nr:class I SAM-dependent RNA methyltransferase [Acidimicrobiia bacterium]